MYCLDTGASTTIVSTNLYHKIPEEMRPSLQPARKFIAADGRPLQCLGQGMFDLLIGDLRINRQLTVGAITDDVMLGTDIIQCDPQGPADLLLSEQRMVYLLYYSAIQSKVEKCEVLIITLYLP